MQWIIISVCILFIYPFILFDFFSFLLSTYCINKDHYYRNNINAFAGEYLPAAPGNRFARKQKQRANKKAALKFEI